jgi:hypothetical protein
MHAWYIHVAAETERRCPKLSVDPVYLSVLCLFGEHHNKVAVFSRASKLSNNKASL